MSVRTAADQGGVARGTWTALEEGTRRTADSNYAGIEHALDWATGSVVAILRGGEPTLGTDREDKPQQAPADAFTRVMTSDLTDAQKRSIVRYLLAEQQRVEKELAERVEDLIRLARGED
jgi:hypothetical protein